MGVKKLIDTSVILHNSNLKKRIFVFFVLSITAHLSVLPIKIKTETKKNNPKYFIDIFEKTFNMFPNPLPKNATMNKEIPTIKDIAKNIFFFILLFLIIINEPEGI